MSAAILPVLTAVKQHSDHETFVRMASIFHKNLGQELAAIYASKLKLAKLHEQIGNRNGIQDRDLLS